jgi:hypothetical protein
MAEIQGQTLYEMNQQLMANEKKMSGMNLMNKQKSLAMFFKNSSAEYFMMLCKERSDYTLFHLQNEKSYIKAADEVILCMKNRGDILAIDRTPSNNSYEIWIRDEDGVNSCYYLFEYDEGVIEC